MCLCFDTLQTKLRLLGYTVQTIDHLSPNQWIEYGVANYHLELWNLFMF